MPSIPFREFIGIYFIQIDFLLENLLFNGSSDWFFLFINHFFFEAVFLLFILFFSFIRETIIKNPVEVLPLDEFGTGVHESTEHVELMLNISVYISAISYFYYCQADLLQGWIHLDSVYFPISFYNNASLAVSFCVFTFFFIFFLMYFLREYTAIQQNMSELYMLFLLFLIFVRFLLSSFDFFTMYLCLEGITYILYITILLYTDKSLEITQHTQKNIFIKYFIYNGVSSLAILFSISCIFAISGNLKFSYLIGCAKYLSSAYSKYVLFFICFLFCLGFFFKLLIFPFFFWAHDFYENLPGFLFILLNTFYKSIVFFTFIKIILCFSFYTGSNLAYSILLYFGFFTFITGMIGALFSAKVRSFLFYTSVNQVGLLLIGLGQFKYLAQSALLMSIFYYFFVYVVTLLFFFNLLYSRSFNFTSEKPVEYLNDLQKLANNNPYLANILSIFLFSFAGIPPFIGFFAKYELFLQIFTSSTFFGLICIVCSIISAFYYIYIIVTMYFNKVDLLLLVSKTSQLKFLPKQQKATITLNDFNYYDNFPFYVAIYLTIGFLVPEVEFDIKLFFLEFIMF